MSAAERKDRLRVPDVYAEGADPLDAVSEAVDQRVPQVQVTQREDLVDHLTGRSRPRVAGEEDGATEVVGDLDHEHAGTVVGRAGSGGEAGHSTTDDQYVDAVERGRRGFRHLLLPSRMADRGLN